MEQDTEYERWYMPTDPRANIAGFRYAHIVIAERALGKPLPAGAEVHHVDENRRNSVNTNLVICQDRAYHQLLHVRTRAFRACGNADWLSCNFCHEYDDPKALMGSKPHRVRFHKQCRLEYQRRRRAEKAA